MVYTSGNLGQFKVISFLLKFFAPSLSCVCLNMNMFSFILLKVSETVGHVLYLFFNKKINSIHWPFAKHLNPILVLLFMGSLCIQWSTSKKKFSKWTILSFEDITLRVLCSSCYCVFLTIITLSLAVCACVWECVCVIEIKKYQIILSITIPDMACRGTTKKNKYNNIKYCVTISSKSTIKYLLKVYFRVRGDLVLRRVEWLWKRQ